MEETHRYKVRDKLVNLISGLGTSGDKANHTRDVFVELNPHQLSVKYASDWMAGKVIDAPVMDVMKKSRVITCPSLGDHLKDFEDFTSKSRVAVDKKIKKVLKWGRLYGGAAVIVGVEGAGENNEPLDVNRIPKDGLKFIHVVSKQKLSIDRINHDALSPDYGQPAMYRVQGSEEIHPSRVFPVYGIEVPEDVKLAEDFWGMSLLQRVTDPIEHVQTILAQLASMVFEANIDTVSVRGLFQMMATKKGTERLTERFRLGNIMKSTHQMMLIDKDLEDYVRNPVDIGKFPDLIPSFLSILAGASNIPATRFLGKSPDGMNATGESDESTYYDLLVSIRNDVVTPLYDFLDPIMLKSLFGQIPDDFSFSFPPFYQNSEQEQADTDLKNAQTDQINLDMGVVQEHHVADRILKTERYPMMTEEDIKEIENMVQATNEEPTQEEPVIDDQIE